MFIVIIMIYVNCFGIDFNKIKFSNKPTNNIQYIMFVSEKTLSFIKHAIMINVKGL